MKIKYFMLAGAALALPGAATAQQQTAPPVIGRTAAEAGPPHWPAMPQARAGAPNVLLIMTDDVGFAASSTFGGPIPTPTFHALAQNGLRYNAFNTAALCSPSRAALLTGRNPHNVNMGNVTNLPTGYDGYTTVIPRSAGTVAEILKDSGYNTAGFGKWHLTPEWEESAIGPFDRWPSGMGFEYFYGFLSGDANQFAPRLIENNRAILKPETPGYILDHDLADRAIGWLHQQHNLAPNKPFFLYYASGTAHAPHHAPAEWIAKFRGQFDGGWDKLREESFARQKRLGVIPADAKLSPRPPGLPAWSSLSSDERRVGARLMEAYAGALAFADHEIGRVIDTLRQSGELDNTLVVYIQGDNGASAEGGTGGELYEQTFVNGYQDTLAYKLAHLDEIGGPKAYNLYPAAWGWAMNTPFQFYKQVASHLGGVRNGMVMSWPARIKPDGKVRGQFHFISDIMPTILDAAGIEAPATIGGVKQQPLDGISMSYTFANPSEPSHRKTQVIEMVQNMGIYHDGWWAGTKPVKAPWDILKPMKIDTASRTWELYDLSHDYSQARDVAKANPAKLAEMQSLFWDEAARNHILPLHDPSEGIAGMPGSEDRRHFAYDGRVVGVPRKLAPRPNGRSFTITVNVTVPESGGNGVLVTQGGRFGGYALYLRGGKLAFHYNAIGDRQYDVRADQSLAAGAHRITADFHADAEQPHAGGTMVLSVDGAAVASDRIDKTLVDYWFTEGLDIGEDTMTPVTDDYTIAESRFNGTIGKVEFDLK